MDGWFLGSWLGVVRVLVVGTLAYAALVLLLRLSGKRTLSKMNAFDLVVTVALGSTVASILTSEGVALVEGCAALIVLVLLQFAVTWTSVRSRSASRLVKAAPTLVYFRDGFIAASLRAERVTEEEVLAAARKRGFASMEEVYAAVLETEGEFSIVGVTDREPTALRGLAGPPRA